MNRLHAIKRDDKTLFPENMVAVTTNPILGIFPPRFLRSRIAIMLAAILGNSETLSIGYGRTKPINLSDTHFCFQHGHKNEIKRMLSWLGLVIRWNCND